MTSRLSLALLALRKMADLCYGLTYAAGFVIVERNWGAAVRSLRSIFDPPLPDKRAHRAFYKRVRTTDRAFYKRVQRVQRARRQAPTRHMATLLFRAVASPDKIIWVRPGALTRKTPYDLNLYFNDILPGNWDLRTGVLDRSPKYRSIIQHFRDGVDWEQTELFKDTYGRRLARGAVIRGNRDLSELAGYYESHFSRLYESIREHGFRAETHAHGPVPDVPHVHIGRDGRILVGNNGNHRLAMAKLLEVEQIPCCVRARHVAWQQVRELVATHGPETCWSVVDPALSTHPDLADLIKLEPSTERHPGV